MSSRESLCIELDKIITKIKKSENEEFSIFGLLTYTKEFLRTHVGDGNEFYWEVSTLKPEENQDNARKILENLLKRLKEYIEAGFLLESTPIAQANLEITSSFLSQSNDLLNDPKVHPAASCKLQVASCMLIGATLEQFLISMLEKNNITVNDKKIGMQQFANQLKNKNVLNKQDVKDITSWAGLRNEAAHGEWDQVNDKNRIRIMLEGVNLFIRKYGEQSVK